MNIRGAWAFALASALVACGGGGERKTGPAGAVDPADSDAMMAAIVTKIGGVVVEPVAGAPPAPSTAEDRPIAKIDTGDQTLTPGQTLDFTATLSPDAQAAMCKIFLKVGGASSFFKSDLDCPSAKASQPGVAVQIPVSVTIPGDIEAGRFCLQVSGQDDQGLVSNVAQICTNVVAPHTVVNQAPVANAGNSQNVNGGDAVTLDGTASTDADGHIAQYQWQQISGGTPVVLSNANTAVASFVAPNVAATYTFALTVTDDKGDTDHATVNVIVTPTVPPVLTVNLVLSSAVLLNDASTPAQGVTITATVIDASSNAVAGSPVTFTTDSGALSVTNATTDSAGHASAVLTTGGDATLRTITVSACAGSEPSCRVGTVQVVAPTPNPTLTFTATPDTVMVNAPATLMWSTNDASDCTASGAWSGAMGTSGSQSVSQAAAGSYTYTLSCVGASGTTPASASVILTVTPTPPPVANAGPDQTVSGGDNVALTGLASTDPGGSPIASYSWQQTSGSPTVTLQNPNSSGPTFVAPTLSQATSLVFTLTVTNSAGLSDTDTVTIDISAPLAPAPTLSQVTAQVNPFDTAYGVTDALVDVVDGGNARLASRRDCSFAASGGCQAAGSSVLYPFGSNTVEQLNNNTADVPVGSSTRAKLTTILQGVRGNNVDQVQVTVARVRVTVPAGVSDFAVSLQGAGGLVDVLFFSSNSEAVGEGPITSDPTLGNSGRWYGFKPVSGATSFDLIVYGDGDDPSHATLGNISAGNPVTSGFARPGDVVKVYSRDANGVLGNFATLTLVDAVPPALAFETGYFLGRNVLSNSLQFGISPASADVVDAVSGPYSGDTFSDSALATSNANGAAYLTSVGASATSVLADATSFAAFSTELLNAVLHVGYTEPIALGPGVPTYTGPNAQITNFVVTNNTPQKDPTQPKINSLRFTVNNLFTLQDDVAAANSLLDMTGAVRDLAGNVATAATNVDMRFFDLLPPLVQSAYFDGFNLVVVFTEPVQKSGHIVFTDGVGTCSNVSIDLSATAVSLFGSNTIVVPVQEIYSQVPGFLELVQDCLGGGFNPVLPAYPESQYNVLPVSTLPAAQQSSAPTHGGIKYVDVLDASGNTWNFWDSLGKGLGDPYFAVANVEAPFVPVTVLRSSNFDTGANQGQPGATVNVTLGFSHPIELDVGCNAPDDFGVTADANCDSALSNAELLAWGQRKFEYSEGVAGALTPSGVVLLDGNGNDVTGPGDPTDAVTLVLSFTLSNAVAASDRIRIVSGQGLTSHITGSFENIFAFDEGLAAGFNSESGEGVADGNNDINELMEIPPTPAAFSCPQTTRPDGGFKEC